VVCGCASNPFKKQAVPPPSLEPPPGVAAPAHTIPQASSLSLPPSYADVDGRQLEAALVRNRQESQVMQDEIAALRDQLASTSSQLAQTRAAGLPPGADKPPRVGNDGGVPATPVVMQSAMTQLKLPDLQPRFDGAVIRIDIPADRLFDGGTANLSQTCCGTRFCRRRRRNHLRLYLLDFFRGDFGFGPSDFGRPPSLIHLSQSHFDWGLRFFSA
jgi:hypothetical protein